MRKILKKKVNVFGKKLPVFVIALMGMFLVSAALTGYIANTVQADVSVSAPIVQGVSKDSGAWASKTWTELITFDDIKGGESITTYGRSENLADVLIKGNTNFIVTNPLGLTCADFEDVTVRIHDGANWIMGGVPLSILNNICCVEKESWKVEFVSPLDPMEWTDGQVYLTETVVTFKTDAVGTYTFSSAITPTA